MKLNMLKLNLVVTLFVLLIFCLGLFMAWKTYTNYGVSWNETTIIDNIEETKTNNIYSHIFSLVFLLGLAFLLMKNREELKAFHNEDEKHELSIK